MVPKAYFLAQEKENTKFELFGIAIMEITKDTILADILKSEEGEKILAKYNLPCLSCPMAKFEVDKLKLGEVCEVYGIDSDKLLKDLNEIRRT